MTPEVRIDAIPGGTLIDGWRVLRAHHHGSAGFVYLVARCGTEEPVFALKIRNPESACCTVEEFKAEIAICRRRPMRENQPAFFGSGTFAGQPYFVMELAEMMPRPMGPDQAYRYFRGIACGLLALHKDHRFHGDIKEGNLGQVNGRPVLLDFGSVRPWVRNLKDPLATTESMLHEDVKETGLYTFLDDLRALAQVMQKYCNDKARARYSEAIEGALRKNESATYTSTKDFIAALDACHKTSFKNKVVFRTVFGAVASLVVVASLAAFGYRSIRDWENRAKETVSTAAEVPQLNAVMSEQVEAVSNVTEWAKVATATPAQTEAWVEEGRKLYEQNHFAEALACFEKAVRTPGFESGYAYGKIAECYYWGRGCPQNKPIGLRFAKYAAELNDPSGKKLLDSFGKD